MAELIARVEQKAFEIARCVGKDRRSGNLEDILLSSIEYFMVEFRLIHICWNEIIPNHSLHHKITRK